MAVQYLQTPVGLLRIRADETAVTEVQLADARTGEAPNAVTALAAARLSAYFSGEVRCFDLPLAPEGTAFQRRVWQALQETGWGEVTTYGALAARIGQPGAARAVGQAVGRNPILILIPCHRVLAAAGLGGFSAGLWRKRTLLRLEGREPR